MGSVFFNVGDVLKYKPGRGYAYSVRFIVLYKDRIKYRLQSAGFDRDWVSSPSRDVAHDLLMVVE